MKVLRAGLLQVSATNLLAIGLVTSIKRTEAQGCYQ